MCWPDRGAGHAAGDRIEDREVVVGIVTLCVGKILIVWARGRGARIASSLK